jgi:hypothetical protein
MYRNQFAEFRALMERIALVFSRPLTDGLVQAYWDALQDLPLAQVEAFAKSHERHGKFFPKPHELRPKDSAPRVPRVDSPEFRDGEKRAHARLEELRVSNPDEWLAQVSPKVRELGRAKGMTDAEIASRMARYLRDGPR